MVIMGLEAGQLANRTIAFAHFIANAIEYGYTLVNPTFGIYQHNFIATSTNNFGGYPITIKYVKFSRILHYFLQLMHRRAQISPIHAVVSMKDVQTLYDLNNLEYQCFVQQKKLIFTYGWRFRDYANLKKNAIVIRDFFRPIPSHQTQIDRLIAKARAQADILVGVHMRRRDYRQWRGGVHFYSDQVYLQKMQQIDAQLRMRGKIALYLLFSDEIIQTNNFLKLPIMPGNNQVIEDLYSLAACDYIIGPPSTYTMWASFYGQTPRMEIRESSQKIILDNFEIAQG